MSLTLSSLSAKLGSNVVDTDIFLVTDSTSTNNNKIERSELAKSFNSLTAQNTSGISLFESAGLVGLTVSGSNGFVGINDKTPFVSLDVVDNTSATNGSGQIRLSTTNAARKIGISITDPSTYYQFSKKANDTKLYLESSINNGSSFTNLMVADQSGNFAIHGTTGSLNRKFLVSGEFMEFQNSGNSFIFDPYNNEIKTNAVDEIFSINYNNLGDVRLGNNGVYIDNDLLSTKVAVGHTIPAYLFHVSGNVTGEVGRFQSNSTRTVLGLRNTSNIGYIGLSTNKLYLGLSNVLNTVNATIDTQGNFGLGITGPQYRLDVATDSSTAYTPASFQSTNVQGTTQIVIAANKDVSLDPTANRNSLLTFSRFDAASSTPKWSIGNLYNDTALGISDNDCFVFIKNGYFGASPDVVAKLTSAGSLDIDGSYTTNSSYCKGQFVEICQTSLTGTSNLYIDPFGVNGSSTVSSGNFNNDGPFAVAMYNGKLERVKLFTSDTFSSNVVFQFYAITPATTSVNGYNNIKTTGDYANVKCSGTVALNTNQVSEIVFSTSGTFTSGQLLQYRLFKSDFTPLNIPVKLSSSLKFVVI
ncbi:hypothetical protein EB169_00260 [archaeon]|nr:hypothetical protein [archaeon]NDB54247.1 hypothetical protein [archaeon]